MIAASRKNLTKKPQWRTRSANSTHPILNMSSEWAAVSNLHTQTPCLFPIVWHTYTEATLYNWLWKDIRLITLFPWGRRDPVAVSRKTKQRDGKIEQNKGRRGDSFCVIRINGREMKGSWDRGCCLSFNIAGNSPPFLAWLRGQQVWVIF